MKNNAIKKRILQGFVLSAILLGITEILYRIPYIHAAALDPMVHNVKIPEIDDRIPVIPVFFFVYIWSYAYWFFAPFFIIRTGRKKTREFIITFISALIICSLILFFFPTKIDRAAEGLLSSSHESFFWDLLRICYRVDGGEVSYNLLPSMHCANCILYYQALKDKAVPVKIRVAALISTIFIIASTLFTKQHYFLDVVAGVLIPILAGFAVKGIGRFFERKSD